MNINNKRINIWGLGNRINIKVNKSFIDFVNDKIREKFITKRKIHKEVIKCYKIPFSTFRTRMKRGYNYFIDLEILMNLCKLLEIPLENFQKNIIAYKIRRGHNYIANPKLPIKITPILDMLIAHFIGDGYVINSKNGRKAYFGYRQYNKEYMKFFIKKVESVFGKSQYKKKYFKNATQVYFPIVCSSLIFKLYNLNVGSFKSEISRIPKEILNKNLKHKLAFLIGIIIDEGNIDSNLIVIRMKNKELIKDLQGICNNLSYTTTIKGGKEGLFCLYITSKNISKFYQDYRRLVKECPEVNLGHKGEKIKEIIKRLKKPKIYIKGNKSKILGLLEKENLTVNQIAKRLNMTRQGARYLVKKLNREDKIELKSVEKFGNYRYGLR